MSQGPAASVSYESYLQQHYMPALDGVRAISVLLVVSVHMYDSGEMWSWLAGAQGVTIFFVLSGYLITTLALREERRSGHLSLAAFYVRRCFRIFPLYYLTVATYAVVILGLGVGAALRPILRDSLPYYLFYLPEVPFYLWAVLGQRDLPFIQGWSLGVEEKFYLIWPFLAFVWWRGRDALRLRGTIALAVGIGLLAGGLSLGNRPLALLGRNFFSYFPILVGCILALLLNDETWFRRFRVLVTRRGTATLGAGFLFVHFATPHVPGILLWNVWGVLYSLATALLLAWVLLGRGHLQTVLERPGLVVLGQHSYGIYLIHGFAISAAYKLVPASLVFPWRGSLTYGIACVLSFGGAVVLARGVERPCIALGRRLSDRLRAGAKVDERTLPGVFAGKVSVNTEDQPLVRLPNDPSLAPASRYGRPRKEMPAR